MAQIDIYEKKLFLALPSMELWWSDTVTAKHALISRIDTNEIIEIDDTELVRILYPLTLNVGEGGLREPCETT